MNMILHGINSAQIANEDTLLYPQHFDDSGELLLFDRVLTNPPSHRITVRPQGAWPTRSAWPLVGSRRRSARRPT